MTVLVKIVPGAVEFIAGQLRAQESLRAYDSVQALTVDTGQSVNISLVDGKPVVTSRNKSTAVSPAVVLPRPAPRPYTIEDPVGQQVRG